MKIISMVSGKGGVGKTASACNLAAGLASLGYRTCLIDIDKQSNTTRYLKSYNPSKLSVCNIFIDRADPNTVVQRTEIENLDIIPGSYDLEDVPDKILLDVNRSREGRLKQIEKLDYDFIIIDCPPSLEILTINALVISDYVLVPIKVDLWGLEGFDKIIRKMDIVRDEYNTKLMLLGAFLTMNGKTNINQGIEKKLENDLKERFFKTKIRQDEKFKQSTFECKPVIIGHPKTRVSIDYKNLALEVLKNVK